MKRRAFIVSFVIVLFATGSLFAQTLGAVLTGSQETPPCSTPGFGTATITFDSARQNVNVNITVANLGSPITASHIHNATTGGNVVLGFTPTASFTNGVLSSSFPITSDLANQILQNPGNFYVNVHTTQCPGGAVRGSLAFVGGGPQTYAAALSGSNETPPNSSTAFGSAFITFDPFNNNLFFDVATNGITSPSASHIHRGATGTAGPVIINFATSGSAFQNGRVAGGGAVSSLQSSSLLPTDLTALAAASTANGYYVNVHSSVDPGGEIRGQLLPAQEFDIPVAGHVTNGIGQTFISDVRVFNPSFQVGVPVLVEFFQTGTTANTNPTNAIVVSIPARGTAVLNDIAGSSSLNITGVGAIRISSVATVIATSRIYVNTNNGSFGQFVPALTRSNALQRGAIPQISNTTAASGFRSNIGFFNPTNGPVTVRLEARDAAGTVVASNLITLQALSQQQNSIGTYFPGVDLSNASNLTLSFSANSAIFGYASEVDNSSGDTFLIPAQPDTGVAASQ